MSQPVVVTSKPTNPLLAKYLEQCAVFPPRFFCSRADAIGPATFGSLILRPILTKACV